MNHLPLFITFSALEFTMSEDFCHRRVHGNKTVKKPSQKQQFPKYLKKKRIIDKGTAAQRVSDQQITGVWIDMRIYVLHLVEFALFSTTM